MASICCNSWLRASRPVSGDDIDRYKEAELEEMPNEEFLARARASVPNVNHGQTRLTSAPSTPMRDRACAFDIPATWNNGGPGTRREVSELAKVFCVWLRLA